MKYKRYIVFLIALILLLTYILPCFASASDLPDISAHNAIVVHRDSGTVVYEKNADKTAYPASLTKLMTALIAAEAIERGDVSADDVVTASDEALNGLDIEGSTANIVAGEQMTLRDLLYCMLMSSANEACNIVAEYIAGSISTFVTMMNERASELGCTGTHFANPHGLHDENHYTTARDMSLIARAAFDNHLIETITSTATYTVPATNMSDERNLTNTNRLISGQKLDPYSYQYAIGGKTGSTSAAGYCLISHAAKGDIEFICVVMGCETEQLDNDVIGYRNFSDTIALYDWAFDNYSLKTIVSASDMLVEVPVNSAKEADYVVLHPANTVTLLLPNGLDTEKIERNITLDSEEYTAPITKGEKLGTIEFSYKGQVIASEELLALTSLSEKKGIFGSSISGPLKTILTVVVILVLIILCAYIILLVSRKLRNKKKKKSSNR